MVVLVPPYIDLGCWVENLTHRAMPTLEDRGILALNGPYRERTDAIRKCGLAAHEAGYTVFALQHGGYCTSDGDGIFNYYKYGESEACEGDGKGGDGALRVYQFKPGTVEIYI